MIKLIPLLLFSAVLSSLSAEFEASLLSDALAPRVKDFLEADTAKARSSMAGFSDEDLQRIVNAFKKDHAAGDQRMFWLAEELYRRNAERVAAERIRYLYYAVLAALAIIAGFTALTYARTRRQQLPSPVNSGTVAAVPEMIPPKTVPSRVKRVQKKGRR